MQLMRVGDSIHLMWLAGYNYEMEQADKVDHRLCDSGLFYILNVRWGKDYLLPYNRVITHLGKSLNKAIWDRTLIG